METALDTASEPSLDISLEPAPAPSLEPAPAPSLDISLGISLEPAPAASLEPAPAPSLELPLPVPRIAEVPKPEGWDALPMFAKIAHYGAHLGPIHAAFTDKLRAKQYVLDVAPLLGLGGLLSTARVLRVLSGPEDLRAEDLAPGKMVKATHGCKWNILGGVDGGTPSREAAEEQACGEAPSREAAEEQACAEAPSGAKELAEGGGLEAAREKLRRWGESVWVSKTSPQRQYASIPPRFFVEEVIPDPHAPIGEALCYMVRCVRGRPICLSVLRGRKQNSYYPGSRKRFMREIPDVVDPPRSLHDALIRCAAALAAPFEFVRVDFHVLEGVPSARGAKGFPGGAAHSIFFSEFTFTPAAGARVFAMSEEKRQGKEWVLEVGAPGAEGAGREEAGEEAGGANGLAISGV